MNSFRANCALLLLLSCLAIQAARHGAAEWRTKHAFRIVPLGVRGGSDESNLSAYLVAREGSGDYICLDAGTLRYGIRKALDSGAFDLRPDGAGQAAGQASGQTADMTASKILRQHIMAYLISHPHLDHVAGLILNSPDDSVKNIYGLPFCLEVLKNNYFTWKSWANFADQGEKPFLNKYHYVTLSPDRETLIEHTDFHLRTFPLSHSAPNQSSAFLLRAGDGYLLYLGDTGADRVEGSDNLHRLWQEAGPLVREGKLKALFIETSFPDEQPEKQLFGHLTPRLLMEEMRELARSSGEEALRKLPILITHIKPSGNNEAAIKRELAAENDMRLRLVYPEQARPLEF